MRKEEAEEWLPIVHWLNGGGGRVAVNSSMCGGYLVDTHGAAEDEENYWVSSSGRLAYNSTRTGVTLKQMRALYYLGTRKQ